MNRADAPANRRYVDLLASRVMDDGYLSTLDVARIRRSDFDAVIDAGYIGPEPCTPAGATIWDGHII